MKEGVPETKTYNQCLVIVQGHLKEIASIHGALKQWCEEESLNYKAIIKIKNGTMTYYVPQLVLKLLGRFGYKASISRSYTLDEVEDIYIVQKADHNPLNGKPKKK